MIKNFNGVEIRSLVFSIAVFLLPALALTTPQGTGFLGAFFLLSTVYFSKELWLKQKELFTSAKWVISAFAFNLLSVLISLAWFGFKLRGLDNPVRELLTVFIIGLLAYTKPKAEWFWYGLFVGTIGAAGIAFYQRFGLGLPRAGGFHQIIMFGDISMTMGLMAVASIPIFKKTRLSFLPYLAFFAGFCASLLSGSRGGWVGLIFLLVLIPHQHITRKKFGQVTLAFGVLLTTVYLVPQFDVGIRLTDASTQFHQYQTGEINTSVGLRLEVWKGAWKMFVEHPVLGVGPSNFNAGLNEFIERGEIRPAVNILYHAHNEILDALATGGMIGGIALIFLYGAPLIFFVRHLQHDRPCKPYAQAGLLLVLSFIGSGLSQVLFAHHIGTAFYSLTVSTLVGLCVALDRVEL